MAEYKLGKRNGMTPELWQAKKVVDSTLHPGGLLPTFALAPSSQKYMESNWIPWGKLVFAQIKDKGNKIIREAESQRVATCKIQIRANRCFYPFACPVSSYPTSL